MPNRMLRDWTNSDKVNGISVHAERFFTRLIMKVDDYGCFFADTRLLRAMLFPLLIDAVREDDIVNCLKECEIAGLITIYLNADKKYLRIENFNQRLDNARSKFPMPEGAEIISTGYIYLIAEANGNMFKIGFSANPWARLKEIQKSSGISVVLRMHFKGASNQEKELIKLLRPYMYNSDWFNLPDSIIHLLSTTYVNKAPFDSSIVAIRSSTVAIRKPLELELEVESEMNKEDSGAELHSATPVVNSTDFPVKKPTRKRNAGARKIFIEPTLQECVDYFMCQYDPKAPRTWFPDRCRIEAKDFLDYYIAIGWVQGKSKTPIVSWKHTASRWIRKAKSGEFDNAVPGAGHNAAPSIPHNQSREKRSKQLPQIEQDINFSFARYREDPTKLTIEMIEAGYFDHFQSRGIIISDAGIIADIKTESAKYITDKQLPDSMLAQVQRKIAVIKIFQLWKTNDREEIFLTD